jgi:hypothetical protein
MRRTLAILAVIIILLLVSVFAYLKFRQYKSFRYKIHKEASLIIKINADQIYATLIEDYLSNPEYYKNRKQDIAESGLEIPGNIFIYTVYSKSNKTYFCSLPIENITILKQFLKIRFGITEFTNAQSGITVGHSKNKVLTVAFNNKTLSFAYSLNKEQVTDILVDIAEGRNLLPDTDSRVNELKKLDTHLSYVYDHYIGTAQFNKGVVNIKGDFYFKQLNVKGKAFKHRVFDNNAKLKTWLAADFLGNFRVDTSYIKNYKFEVDSLLKYYKGYADAELINTVNQKESIVTYEYNDDFEKTEVTTVKDVQVPEFNVYISTEVPPTTKYLGKIDVLLADRTLNKKVFPLYTIYNRILFDGLVLSTNRKNAVLANFAATPYFFYLEANLNEVRKLNQFPLLTPHITTLKDIRIAASKLNEDTHHFDAVINFNDREINALGQLFKLVNSI